MKRSYILLLLLLTCTTLSAQRFQRRGIALGADRDTLQFIIASPFDNWWINLGGGITTYIGNTPDPQAYWNRADIIGRFEVGKWIIPDVALSLRLDLFHASTRTCYGGNNPWADFDNPVNYDGAEYGPYYPISVLGFSVSGLFTFDWTNFLRGYEVGKRRKVHVLTPVGLGVTCLVGSTINKNFVQTHPGYELDELRWNKELSFNGGLMLEYYASKHLAFHLAAEAKFARGSLDDHNYNVFSGKRHIDWMPSAVAGVKLNLLKTVRKYNQHTRTSSREKVNHEFLAYGTRNTVSNLNARIDRLEVRIDSAERAAQRDSALIAAMREEAGNLQDMLDSIQSAPAPAPTNVLADLIAANEVLGLPATIVYFKLDKYDLDYNGRKRLQNFARDVADLPDTCEYYIIGAADSATGTPRHNVWLSEHRCDAAFTMLVRYCGMDANQIIQVPVGGITDYEPQENNRMAMVILRTPDTEAIIERWLQRRVR